MFLILLYNYYFSFQFYIKKLHKCIAHTHHIQFLSSNFLLNQFQTSFYPHHFTKTSLVKVNNDLHLADSNGHLSVPIVLDLSEAFNPLYHFFLLKILALVGLHTLLVLFHLTALSFLFSMAASSPSPSLCSVGIPGGRGHSLIKVTNNQKNAN